MLRPLFIAVPSIMAIMLYAQTCNWRTLHVITLRTYSLTLFQVATVCAKHCSIQSTESDSFFNEEEPWNDMCEKANLPAIAITKGDSCANRDVVFVQGHNYYQILIKITLFWVWYYLMKLFIILYRKLQQFHFRQEYVIPARLELSPKNREVRLLNDRAGVTRELVPMVQIHYSIASSSHEKM